MSDCCFVCTALLLLCAQKGSVKDVSLISSAESGAVRAHWWLLETEMRKPVGCGLWAKHATLGCMRVAVMLTTPVTMRVDIKTHRDSPIQVPEGSCVCVGGREHELWPSWPLHTTSAGGQTEYMHRGLSATGAVTTLSFQRRVKRCHAVLCFDHDVVCWCR